MALDIMPTSIPIILGPGTRTEIYSGKWGHHSKRWSNRFNAFTEQGREKTLVVRICEVNQSPLSVSKGLKAGNRVVLDNPTGFIESNNSVEETWLHDQEGMVTFKM